MPFRFPVYLRAFTDRIAGYFVPSAIPGCGHFLGGTFLASVPPGINLRGCSTNTSTLVVCLLICMSVIVVDRPNTFGLSTSTAIVDTGVGPMNGIFVKDECALKARRGLRRVAPRETGTVTKENLTLDC